jgi:hypothetical protein
MVSFKDPKIWREFAKACLGLPKPSLLTLLQHSMQLQPARGWQAIGLPGQPPPALSPTGPPVWGLPIASGIRPIAPGPRPVVEDKLGSSLASSYSLLTIYGGLFFFRV